MNRQRGYYIISSEVFLCKRGKQSDYLQEALQRAS